MKKLAFDSSNWKLIGTINDLIDLVNSQQEAIEKLEKRVNEVDAIDGSWNLWGRDIDKRLWKTQSEVKGIGEALLYHYNNPDAHKPIPEEPLEPVDNKVDNKKTQVDDTHRTVTLRIPKGMTFVESLFYADLSLNMSDNQAKKALDEVQPNE